MKICLEFALSCCLFLLFLFRSTNCIQSKRAIPATLEESILSEIRSQEPEHFLFKNRERRFSKCPSPSTHNPEIDTDLNPLNEDKDYIDMKWLSGDTILMLASDRSLNSIHPSTNTSVWRIDATDSGEVNAENLKSHVTQPILTFAVNPLDRSNALLIATDLKTIFVLHGTTWSTSKFPYELSIPRSQLLNAAVLQSILFHPDNPAFLMLAFGQHIYFSRDSGALWDDKGPSNVVKYRWGHGLIAFFQTTSNSVYEPLYCTRDLFLTYKVIHSHVITWYYENGILLISKQNENDPTNKTRTIWVSADSGDSFNLAHIPEVSAEQFYTVIAITESYAMLHLGNTSSPSGQLYISDSKFTSYTLSLNNHYSKSFYQVQSIRGVYIASIPVSPNSLKVRTLITYNAGAEWMRIPFDNCPSQQQNCHLHIYVTDVLNKNVDEVKSLGTAKGLIIGYGVIGDNLNLGDTSNLQLFISNDGGYKWESSLSSDYQVLIGNYGNLLVGVKLNTTADSSCFPISTVLMAHQQGECWREVKLPTNKIKEFKSCGVNMEPGASSMKAFFWGVYGESQEWSFLVIDFQEALDRACGTDDFETFTPHVTTGCLFGYNETFQRVMKDSICFIGTSDLLREHQINPCKCDLEFDFECDFGYERQIGSNMTCSPIPGYDVAQHCLP